MAKPGIVICVSGGVVQAVFASRPDIAVTVIDWDADSEDYDLPGVVAIERDGITTCAFVFELTTDPLSKLSGSDTAVALRAMETQRC